MNVFKELINRNKGKDFNYFIRVTTDFITYDVNIVLTDWSNVLIDYETIKTFKRTELAEMKMVINNLKTIYVVEDEMQTIDTKRRYMLSELFDDDSLIIPYVMNDIELTKDFLK